MTPTERELVADVLRCAADLLRTGRERWESVAVYRAADSLLTDNEYVLAHEAVCALDRLWGVRRDVFRRTRGDDFCLEAAALVEEAAL